MEIVNLQYGLADKSNVLVLYKGKVNITFNESGTTYDHVVFDLDRDDVLLELDFLEAHECFLDLRNTRRLPT